MAKKSIHVVPDLKGGWSVKEGGASRASKRFDTQQDAATYARNKSKDQGAEVVIHRSDGTIRNKKSYGSDPFPSHDTHR